MEKGDKEMKAEKKLETNIKKVEKIVAPPPKHWVGDGFNVHGFFPHGPLTGERMSPFFLLDYNSLVDFPPREKPFGVGPHPHRGFETVSIAYRGKVAHHDSRGGGGVIGEGDVQWMTAGSGLLHKEYHEEEYNKQGGPFQMVQLWVNLPAKDKMTTPKYQAITNSEMGRVALPQGGEVEIIAGEYGGVKGPAATFSPVHLYNLKPKAGEKIDLKFPAGYTTAILAIEGELDDISGLGQTRAALKISTTLPDAMKKYHMAPGAGHYGIFNGSRWRTLIAPVVEEWIAAHNLGRSRSAS